MNVQRVFQALVNLGATWVLWVLVALSVIGLAVILERAIFFTRTRTRLGELREHLLQQTHLEQNSMLRQRLRASASIEARIVAAGLAATSPVEADERLAAETHIQRLRAEKNLAFLGTLGNNAPFVGLLGTVVGIIGAFAELDASRGQLTTGLMAEIGEALVATAVGLVVALPAVAAFNTFQRAITVRLAQGEAMGRELVAGLHMAAHHRDDPSPTAENEPEVL